MINNEYFSVLNGDWLFKFLTKEKLRWLRWTVAMVLQFVMYLGAKRWGEFSGFFDYLDGAITITILTAILYVNIYILVPKLFYSGHLSRYLLMLSITTALGWLIGFLIHEAFFEAHRLLPKIDPNETVFSALFVPIFLTPIYLVSTAFKLFQRWATDTRKINELQSYAMESELKALRSQIQPHFLFNMLNSVVIANRQDPELGSSIVIKLSDFLRYLLYESNQHKVYLSGEVRFINDFLTLEKMRRDQFEFEIIYSHQEIASIKIPPHLMITLVENASKHSVDPMGSSYIKLELKVMDKQLSIICENSMPLKSYNTLQGGVGLTNMKRRLELLYATNYFYQVDETFENYKVTLNIPI